MRTKVFILALIGSLFLSCESVEETIDPCADNQCFIVEYVERKNDYFGNFSHYIIHARKICNNSSIAFEGSAAYYKEGYKYCD